jgi:hypothetical protein
MKRRSFLQAAGAGVPAVEYVGAAVEPEKFSPIELDRQFNASSREFGPRPAARNLNPPAIQDSLIHSLGGEQQIRGIPFRLGPADVAQKSWIVLSTRTQPWTAPAVEIPIGRTAGFVCLAQFCDWDAAEFDPEDVDAIERIGETLAEAVLVYED